jgi:hypothetical protein
MEDQRLEESYTVREAGFYTYLGHTPIIAPAVARAFLFFVRRVLLNRNNGVSHLSQRVSKV